MSTSGMALRLLVKTSATGANAELTMTNGGTAEFTIKRIGSFASPAPTVAAWQIWTLQTPPTEPTLWDLCHRLVEGKVGFDGGAPVDGATIIEFAEPVFQQSWGMGVTRALAMAAAGGGTRGAPEDPDFPTELDPYWFRDEQHAQFDDIPGIPNSAGAAADPVRIAHLDTGYDPNHKSLPAHIRPDLERNFVDPDHPNNATDDSTGFFNSLGHGTGTLGILAGKPTNGHALGGAPDAEIVPIRVANSVVLFGNDAVTQAFQYVWEKCQDPATRIHVVTMSMGGLPCQAWVEYVNQLYEAGVFIVTASGNNFGNLPISTTVYPALFQRVVGACGVMADFTPYADLPWNEMAGNYGPQEKMTTEMAAYTPNIPWAKFGAVDVIDYNGAGTSSATPQIAAAAALWIQRHKAEWDGYSEDWMRVEAVRKALFDSAAKSSDTLHIGQGMLRAADALEQAGAAESDLTETPADVLEFPFLDLVPAEAIIGPGGIQQQQRQQVQRRMLELEALQHAHTSPSLLRLVHPVHRRPRTATPKPEKPMKSTAQRSTPRKTATPTQMAKVRAALVAQPNVSRTLQAALQVKEMAHAGHA